LWGHQVFDSIDPRCLLPLVILRHSSGCE
jgi:hypothetical protein